MKWFKHDADASIDAKLQTLLLDYGAAGYGLYWYCVELIAQGVCENNITFELEHDARIIARNLNLTIQETKDMMKKMIDLKLFSISENDKLACYALAKRLDQSMTSNQGMRNLIASIKSNSHDKVMIKSEDSHDKVKAEEKRRENNIIDENVVLFDSIWKEYTLGFLKNKGRSGGNKQKAIKKFQVLINKYRFSDIEELIKIEMNLKIGHKDLERVLSIENMEQYKEDIAYNLEQSSKPIRSNV